MTRKRIDLGKVRAARKRLEEVAKEHPELLGESSPDNLKGWESTLRENEMGKTTLVAFRPRERAAEADWRFRQAA